MISKDNYKDVAQKAIQNYKKKAMIIDAAFWAAVINHYERELAELEDRIRTLL
jgi:hypothetical protein